MKTTANDKLIAYLALFSGIAISCVAEFYSIMGLMAIYPAALIPIIIMGVVLGVGKLSATVWVKQSWAWSPLWLRLYILPAIAVLMIITSVGVFGFLSKAHSDQSLVSGEVLAKIAIYDEKIKTEKDNIDASRKQLKQMDEAVDQVMARSTSEGGADKAVAIRRSQQKDRGRLLAEIQASQQKISVINEQRAPIAAEVRKVEAEVGPIKYIAAFIYGETNETILEKAVTWISILIVIVLDPLAIVLLLASQYSFQRFREIEEAEEKKDKPYKLDFEGIKATDGNWIQTGPSFKVPLEEYELETYSDLQKEPYYEPDDGPLTDQQIDQIREIAKDDLPTGEVISTESLTDSLRKPPEAAVEFDITAPKPIISTEESRIVRTKVFPRPSITIPAPDTYVQNEEQNESNIWSSTIDGTPASDNEDHVKYLAANIRAGRMNMNEVPAELVERVKARL
jgi:hypothetical protein